MTQPLPQALAAYYAAIAIVKDEGEEMHGHADIRAWMEETSRKYKASVETKTVEHEGETYTVGALVSGTFPGSPAMLHYYFTLVDGLVSHLEIG